MRRRPTARRSAQKETVRTSKVASVARVSGPDLRLWPAQSPFRQRVVGTPSRSSRRALRSPRDLCPGESPARRPPVWGAHDPHVSVTPSWSPSGPRTGETQMCRDSGGDPVFQPSDGRCRDATDTGGVPVSPVGLGPSWGRPNNRCSGVNVSGPAEGSPCHCLGEGRETSFGPFFPPGKGKVRRGRGVPTGTTATSDSESQVRLSRPRRSDGSRQR